MISATEISCGVRQLSELYRPNHVLLSEVMHEYARTAHRQGRKNGFAQVIFSDVLKYYDDGGLPFSPNSERFKSYLLKQFPNSELVQLQAKRSPSTGNTICTYVWNIPHVQFKKHRFYPKGRTRR